jgi:hypothetical protein
MLKNPGLLLIVSLTILLLINIPVKADQSSPQAQWSDIFTRSPRTVNYTIEGQTGEYNVLHPDAGYEVTQTADGGFVIVGTFFDDYAPPHTGGITNGTGVIIKVSPSGTTEKQQLIPVDSPASVYQTQDGGFIIGNRVELVKLDSSGNVQWIIQQTWIAIKWVIQTSDGNYLIAGLNTDGNAIIAKADKSGNVFWNQTLTAYNPSGSTYVASQVVINSIVKLANGNYAIAGTYTTEDGSLQGSNLWFQIVEQTGAEKVQETFNIFDSATGNFQTSGRVSGVVVTQTTDGGYILAGELLYPNSGTETGYYAPWLMKLDSEGNMQWSHKYADNSDNNSGFALAVQTPDGGYLAVGSIYDSSSKPEYAALLVKTDTAGNVEWRSTYGEVNLAYSTEPMSYVKSAVLSADGGFAVGGTLNNTIWLAKFGPEAAQVSEAPNGVIPLTVIPIAVILIVISMFALKKFKRQKNLDSTPAVRA